MDKKAISRLLGSLLAFAAPAIPIITLVGLIVMTNKGGGSDDAVGWTMLFVICVGIGLAPVVGASAVPAVIFLASSTEPGTTKRRSIMLAIDGAIVMLEFLILGSLDFLNIPSETLLCLALVYIIGFVAELYLLAEL